MTPAATGTDTAGSLVGAPHAEWDLLSAGAALQAEIGTFEPSLRIEETT